MKKLRKNSKKVKAELQQKISEAKNKSFRQFASQLDHTVNSNIFWAIRNVGKRMPARIDQLAIKNRDGKPVTNVKSKVDLLSTRYQTPLGYHPKNNRQRIELLRSRRKQNETNYLEQDTHP